MRFLEVFKGLDWKLLIPLLIIQIFGILGVFSALYGEGLENLIKKHLLYILLGWVIIIILSRERFRNILDLSIYIYLFTLFLLILVLVAGKEVYGSKRWLSLGFINIQPSELMKLSLILLTAYLLPYIKSLKNRYVFLLFLAYAMPAVITLKQPDLGTTVSYFVPLIGMIIARGVPLRYILATFILLILSFPLIWNFLLKDYQKKRILAVLDPYSDYFHSGYQIIQSLIAIGSGGLTGKGFLNGTQSQLLFLPEAHTDFVFSVIGEEWGFIGSFILILAIFLFLLRILYYMNFCLTKSQILFVAGVFSLLLFQYSVNIFMALGMFPVVGIPLPFVSFGGSAMLTFSTMIGILLSIYREYHEEPAMLPEKYYE